MKFYKELLMDHFKNPRNRGQLEKPDFIVAQFNPSCGDKISVQGVVKDGILIQVAFEGKGCVISQASASMLSELCLGKPINEILRLKEEDILKIIGMELGPIRIKCALLSLMALQEGILEYKQKNS
jgi:nitrogen fixation NifU-like protein